MIAQAQRSNVVAQREEGKAEAATGNTTRNGVQSVISVRTAKIQLQQHDCEDACEYSSSSSSSLFVDQTITMPIFGLGLSHNNGGWSTEAVVASIHAGVRLFDTATRYGSEEPLGKVLQAAMQGHPPFEKMASSPIPRGQFFVTTKFWPGDLGKSRVGVQADMELACLESLKKLQLQYIDLYLIHWPGRWAENVYVDLTPRQLRQTMWKGMESLLAKGFVKAIGVSNFEPHHLEDIMKTAKVSPSINQFELNPFLLNEELRETCRKYGIQIEGYCPLAKGQGLTHPKVIKAAKELATLAQVTPAALLMAWSLLRCGAITIPKSCNAEHIQLNIQQVDGLLRIAASGGKEAALLMETLLGLDTLHCNLRSTWDPSDVS